MKTNLTAIIFFIATIVFFIVGIIYIGKNRNKKRTPFITAFIVILMAMAILLNLKSNPLSNGQIAFTFLILAINLNIVGYYFGASQKARSNIIKVLGFIYFPVTIFYLILETGLISGLFALKWIQFLKPLPDPQILENVAWVVNISTAVSLVGPIVPYFLKDKSARIISIILIPIFVVVYISANMMNFYISNKSLKSVMMAAIIVTFGWANLMLILIFTYMVYLYFTERRSIKSSVNSASNLDID